MALAASADDGSTTTSLGFDVETVEYERQLRTEAAGQRQYEIQQAFARAAAHAGMPSTMYASTPSDPNHVPHVMPGSATRTTSIVDLVTPRYLESMARTESRPISQRWQRVLRTIRAIEQDRRSHGEVLYGESVSHPLTAATTSFVPESTRSNDHVVIPYFPSASDSFSREGEVRFVNRSSQPGTVTIQAIDDHGRMAKPLVLSIDADSVSHLNSAELEYGSKAKGLKMGTDSGQGAWSLRLTSTVDLEILAYVQTPDGFLAPLQHISPKPDDAMLMFRLARTESNQTNLLRLVNQNSIPAMATVFGFDKLGRESGKVTIEIPAHHARTYTAHDLVSGAVSGLSGFLSESTDNWQLSLPSDADVLAMSFVASTAGHLTTSRTHETTHDVPLFMSATNRHDRKGLVRIANRENRSGNVNIRAFDDSGRWYEELTLTLEANSSAEVDSDDLEFGNPSKGLTGNTGSGEGNWRFKLESDLALEVTAFVVTPDGLLAPMQATVPRIDNRYDIAMFKRVDATNQIGLLRLNNKSAQSANVTLQGTDDHGLRSGKVELTLPSYASRTLTATELELGDADLNGALGNGIGAWRLEVTSDIPIEVMNLISTPTGHLSNLSSTASIVADDKEEEEEETAESVFETQISPIVQTKCINCHVEGGASQNTRLVFVGEEDKDHLKKNLAEFQALLAEVDDGANYILNKIQGIGHGGGRQVNAGSDEFTSMQRFLELLGEDVDAGPSIAVETLFDGVTMESNRQTLRRAAIVFAGRIPTEDEYATLIESDESSLRNAIRALMEGPGFHDFLIRTSNDRLLTDRHLADVLEVEGFFVEFDNEYARLCEEAHVSGDTSDWFSWENRVQYGVARAPLELIAYIVENDLPYTEILEADYIMANPPSARAYGAHVQFEDSNDVHEFRPAEIDSYYRKDNTRVLGEAINSACGAPIIEPGELATDLPHAGILNTNAFLRRYPTTATNRNRARSRWTYYHFLGVDIEKSNSRTTDPDALADNNNPTLNNPACTGCHLVMDPVAGAFQNYGDTGNYRDQFGGMDSLDNFYKTDPTGGTDNVVDALSWDEKQIVSVNGRLARGRNAIGLKVILPPNQENESWTPHLGIDHLTVRSSDGSFSKRYELEEVFVGRDDWPSDGEYCGVTMASEGEASRDSYRLWECLLVVYVEVPLSDVYLVDIAAWILADEGRKPDATATLRIWAPGYFYEDGDTWYRDMLQPGFGDLTVPTADNSLQWLANEIVADERFAEATVKFWWAPIMGAEVAESPEDENDADIEGMLLAAESQAIEVSRLSDGFRSGFHQGSPYNVKDLLVEIVMSKWFRTESILVDDSLRAVSLAYAGAKRLLTPEELDRKTGAITGFQWGRSRGSPGHGFSPWQEGWSNLTGDDNGYRLLYGGIDSDGITARARELTSVMAGVVQTHAANSSCPVVMRELFLLPDDSRLLFEGIDQFVTPTREFGKIFEIAAASREEIETHSVEGKLRKGDVTVKLAYLNDYWDGPTMDRDILLDRLRVVRGEEVVMELEIEDHQHPVDCHHIEQGAFHLSGSGPECVLSIPVSITIEDTYTIEVTAWGDQAGNEVPQLAISVESDVMNSAGSIAIRTQLVDLYDKLLGMNVTTDSDEIRSAYELFVEVWQQNLASESRSSDFLNWPDIECEWGNDAYFLEGILERAWLSPETSGDGQHGWDWEHVHAYFDSVDFSDPQATARTWVSVMAYLLMDYRYLYF